MMLHLIIQNLIFEVRAPTDCADEVNNIIFITVPLPNVDPSGLYSVENIGDLHNIIFEITDSTTWVCNTPSYEVVKYDDSTVEPELSVFYSGQILVMVNDFN